MASKQSKERSRGPKGHKREQEVLDAAAKTFYERGYADATVQDVADALGILKGSLYYYIDVKEDLLFRLLEQVHDDVDAGLERLLATREEDEPPLVSLEAYVRQQTRYNVGNLMKVTVYYHDMDQLTGERHRHILKRRKAHQDYVTDLIRRSQADGTTDSSIDAELLSNCVFGTIIWTYRWYRKRGRYTMDAVVDACARYVLDGLRPALP